MIILIDDWAGEIDEKLANEFSLKSGAGWESLGRQPNGHEGIKISGDLKEVQEFSLLFCGGDEIQSKYQMELSKEI